ncbi:type II toxin-antitoxin system VapC family toxin [Aquabacterium sp.]|uniref:type II toxin-antitoxin system VapC family toxin n=1 Tax=Aquabacterium sp. TaxID=1872578 RepID=UPI002B877819|nr:type II toxin-antitoxin system VapC family toxin [Aquabacterium sp.]HSW07155.1 type II toxin-antitoxin system VapC family toxin [Aquabacterium sp.]
MAALMPGTGAFVVDASVSAAWFLPDEATPATELALQATATHDVWVPGLWLLEVGNLLLSAQRRKRITAEKRRELAIAAAALRIRVDRESVAIDVLDDIAARHGLSAYDAAYLELALRRGLPLATQDEALRAAMSRAGVQSATPAS